MWRVFKPFILGLPSMTHADPQGAAVVARHTSSAILLHWLVAVLIVVVGGIGLAYGSVPRPTRPFWLNLHATVGVLMTLAIAGRIACRIFQKPPAFATGESKVLESASKGVHSLMYVLMCAIPATGLVAFIWHGRIFHFGAFDLDLAVASTRSVYHPAQSIHVWLAYGFIAAITLHVLAALWHQFFLRDNLMGRMLVQRRPSTNLNERTLSERSDHAL